MDARIDALEHVLSFWQEAHSLYGEKCLVKKADLEKLESFILDLKDLECQFAEVCHEADLLIEGKG